MSVAHTWPSHPSADARHLPATPAPRLAEAAPATPLRHSIDLARARTNDRLGASSAALAGLIVAPVIVGAVWLIADTPILLQRSAGPLAAIAAVTFGVALFVVTSARQRARAGVHSLARFVHRIESGDYVGRIDAFPEPEFQRLADACGRLADRLTRSEEALTQERRVRHSEMSRYESAIEDLQMTNYDLSAESGALHALGSVLNRELPIPQICAELIANLASRIAYSRATVYVFDRDGTGLVPRAVREPGNPTPLVGDFLDKLATVDHTPSAIANQAVTTGRTFCIDDTRSDSRCADVRTEARSLLLIPLRAGGTVNGVVQLEHVHRKAFSAADQRVAQSMATTTAIAIHNVVLIQDQADLKALQKIDRLKTDLLNTVSHELRTPLVSIKGYAQTLVASGHRFSAQNRREHLDIIIDESDRLNAFIEDLLQASQIEAGVLRVTPQAIGMAPLIRRVVGTLQARTDRHTIVFEEPGPIPLVLADEHRIEQVVRNLIENALKYSPNGGAVTVRGRVTAASATFTVSDQGIGIAPEHQKRVFERYFRVTNAVSKVNGTGLGLAICRGIVEAHRGRIWVESTPGVGSTFGFTLPLAPDSGSEPD